MEVQGRDLGAPVLGARENLLGDEGSLGSSFLAAQAPDAKGLALGLRALETGRLLGEEVVEAPPNPRLLCGMEGEAARRTAKFAPRRRRGEIVPNERITLGIMTTLCTGKTG